MGGYSLKVERRFAAHTFQFKVKWLTLGVFAARAVKGEPLELGGFIAQQETLGRVERCIPAGFVVLEREKMRGIDRDRERLCGDRLGVEEGRR